MNEKKIIITVAVLFLFLTVLFCFIYFQTGSNAVFSCAITFGTIAYHFVMRLCVGGAFSKFMNNRADYSKKWYQQRPWEKQLYKKLKVKQWKNKMVTFDPDLFDPEKHSLDEIVQAMCQAELVHETIIILSFVPILASVRVGALPVFVITSVLAACLDLVSVIIQRFNRPRVIKLIEREKNRGGIMAITVNIRYTGENGNARKFAEEMERSGTAEAIRAEAGNRRYEYYFPMNDTETVLLIDSWENQEAIDAHHASPMMATIMELREKYDLHMTVERYVSEDLGTDETFIRK